MQSFRKIRQTLKRKKKPREIYTYKPLEGKNGYAIEYQHPNYSQVFHYKYKENTDGTLTKYGYLLNRCDGDDNYQRRGCHKSEKDYIFFQTVADKEQIELEQRWMEELRCQQQICLFPDEEHEWREVMQHNNQVTIIDGIQRRRVHEVLDRMTKECDFRVEYEKLPPGHQRPVNHEPLPMLDTITRIRDAPPTPHSSPTTPMPGYSFSANSLLNVNISQRINKTSMQNSGDVKNNRLKKQLSISSVHPTFNQKGPVVHEYDPEESLVYKECRCEHCLIGDYNE